MSEVLDWLKIAKSNLKLGKVGLDLYDEDIRYEELCFQLQQSVEKSLKSLLVFHDIKFPKTHNIAELLKLLSNEDIKIPENILDSAILTQYAVNTRYPDDFIEVTENDYKEAIEIAEIVYNWVKKQLG